MKKSLAFATLYVLAITVAASAAAIPARQSDAETYLWHGELVALDQTAKVITVKSTVWGGALEELGHFKAGDRIMLGWSGLDKYANAVNHVTRYDATKKSDERFAFPAEFVSFDATQKFVTFKVPIPAEGLSKLQSLKPGQWVTATSRHGNASLAQPIVSIRGFNDIGASS